MIKDDVDKSLLTDYLGCFGNFSLEDPICKTVCAINLRCAIEREQIDRIEILQELAFSDDLYEILQ
jgi:hypothetical protein